jgi:hypothetical protein
MGAYALLIDRHEVDAWAALFDEPSELVSDGRAPFTTDDARRAMASAVPAGVHVGNAPVIVVNDTATDTATAQQVFLFVNLASGTSLGGWYDDQLIKRDGVWRFKRRAVHYFVS